MASLVFVIAVEVARPRETDNNKVLEEQGSSERSLHDIREPPDPADLMPLARREGVFILLFLRYHAPLSSCETVPHSREA